MDSMPPATASWLWPVWMDWAASMMAFMPDAQTLFTVVQATDSARPAPRAAWRAGAWPAPAWSTWPMKTSSTAAEGAPD